MERSREIYWSEFKKENDYCGESTIDFNCPYCDGTGRKSWDELDEDEKEEVIEVYEENGIENSYRYNRKDFDFYCEECDEGKINPSMNYAYPLEHTDLTNENKKIALDCGLFLFEDDEGTWMSLVGGGMDYSPNILLAYRLLEGEIPAEWAVEWRQDYRAYLSEKNHRLNAEACKESLKGIADMTQKLKEIELYLADSDNKKRRNS